MRPRHGIGCAVLFAAALLPARGRALTTGTCTAGPGGVVVESAGGFGAFPFAPAITALPIPVIIDEQAGTFTMQTGGVPPLDFDTPAGIATLDLTDPPAVTGTIDAAGNVALPRFPVRFILRIPGTSGIELATRPTLATAVQNVTLVDLDVATVGAPLDFATGRITLEGAEVIPNAPVIGQPVISGLRLACTLGPIPDRAALAQTHAGARLERARGTIRIGAPPKAPSKPDKGDTLALAARWVAPGPPDVATQNTFVQITAHGADVLRLLIAKGTFTTKGKSAIVRDKSGSTLDLLAGAKTPAAGGSVAGGGTITLKTGAKGTDLVLKLQGLDLGALAGAATVTLTFGPTAASIPVTVRGSGKTRQLR